MNAFGTIVGIAFGIALLVALAAGGYFAIKFMLDLFGTLEPQIATITAIASVVALLCAAIIAGGFKWMGRKEKEMQVRAEKANLYERMLLIWGEKLKERTKAIEPSVEDELQKLERLLALRGSPKVIKAYGALQTLEQNAGLDGPELPSQVAKVLLEMRKDLGQGRLDLNESDLINVLNIEVHGSSSASTTPPVGKPQVSLSQGT